MPLPDVLAATRSYEEWAAACTPITAAGRADRHRLMAKDPFAFLRGSYYRWAQRWAREAGPLADAVPVLAVGDAHIENFGTWRDAEGRLAWGVNDLDEADTLPWPGDLVRLLASAMLAARTSRLGIAPATAAAAILKGYTGALDAGGDPVLLDGGCDDLHLGRGPAGGARFWRRIARLHAAGDVPAGVGGALRAALPDGTRGVRILSRTAGMGSRDHLRFVAVGTWSGGPVAREVKALSPPATRWLRGDPPAADAAGAGGKELAGRIRHSPDPSLCIAHGWVLRRLAPDCRRVELSDLPAVRKEKRLLRAMGREIANVHLASVDAAVLQADLAARPDGWLLEAARGAVHEVRADFAAFAAGKLR
ncbi:MAG: DUF2252 family protein [Pseudonocardia sp.]|uniref:DUF2252 family protein n=1 Tax=Pseudonocardia sp. TaxID=60912 RepID=UPI001ACE4A24|nr:DUF2252 family protein [Pseudonocardia sp.]MBN9101719.1 DUF2252 family protein [Pseudonocardia sp.]